MISNAPSDRSKNKNESKNSRIVEIATGRMIATGTALGVLHRHPIAVEANPSFDSQLEKITANPTSPEIGVEDTTSIAAA